MFGLTTKYNIYPYVFQTLEISLKQGLDVSQALVRETSEEYGLVVNDLLDELNTISGNYRLLLRSVLMNVNDPERESMKRRLMSNVVDVMVRFTTRIHCLLPATSVARERKRVFESAVISAEQWDNMRLELSSKGTSTEEYKIYDKNLKTLYDTIAFGDGLDKGRMEGVMNIIDDSGCTIEARLLAVSALTIFSLRQCSVVAFNALVDIATYHAELRHRALVGIVFNLLVYDDVLTGHSKFSDAALKTMLADNVTKNAMMTIIKLIFMALSAERVAQHIEEKFGSAVRTFVKNFEKNADTSANGEQPQWMKKVESVMADNIDDIMRLYQEGYDIHYGSFQKQKGLPYWSDEYHWFTPFYPQDPAISNLFESGAAFLITMLLQQDFSDTQYKSLTLQFAYLSNNIIDKIRGQVEKELGTEMPDEDLSSLELKLARRYGEDKDENIKFYIHDLYRFASQYLIKYDKLSGSLPRALSGVEPTLMPFDLQLMEKQLSATVARYFYDADNHDEELLTAAFSIARLDKDHVKELINNVNRDYLTVDRLKQLGYLHQQLGNSFEALRYLERADAEQPNDTWTLRHIFECHLANNDSDMALAVYEQLTDLFLSTDDIDLEAAKLYFRTAHYSQCLMCCDKIVDRIGDSAEALYISLKASLKMKDYEAADTKCQTLLAANRHWVMVYLYAGHFMWMKGEKIVALEYYRMAYKTHCEKQPVKNNLFIKMFRQTLQDYPFAGSEDIILLCEAAMYDEL